MTDTGSLTVDPQMLRDKVNDIAKIDEALDAASGSEAAGMRALGKQLAEENKSGWQKNADSLIAAIQKSADDDPEKLAGLYTGIVTQLQDTFRESVNKFLDAESKARKAGQESQSYTEEEITSLEKERKVAMEQYRALKQILELFGHQAEIESIPPPKTRTGSRGKRGPRVLTGYDFYIDGTPRSSSQNNLSSIANTVTNDDPLNWKTIDLKNFLEEKLAETGNSLENPPVDGFEFVLPTGKNDGAGTLLKAVPGTPKPVDETDDEQDVNGDEDENGNSEVEESETE